MSLGDCVATAELEIEPMHIIICGDYVVDDESRAKILTYVRQGGKLVLLSPSLGRNVSMN